jgi:multiple sugar transport system substrate-binding protein
MSNPRALGRRRLLLAIGAAGGALVAACGAQPAPTSVPAKTESKPPEPTKPAAEAPKPTSAPEPTKPAAAAEPTKPAAAAAPTPTQAAAAAAAKPAPTVTPPPPQLRAGQTLVTLMHQRNELSEEEQKQFEDANPNTRIYLINNDLTAMIAMTAAGNPPDVFRVLAPDIPGFLARKIVKDLTSYFQSSKLVQLDDLAPANRNYWFNGLTAGNGSIYGMVKDWSPDLTLWLNKKIFQAAGVALPSDEKRLTYQEVGDLARKLNKRVGDRTEVFGFGGFHTANIDRIVEVQLNSSGQSLWEADFSRIKLTGPEAREALEYWFKLAKDNVVPNPLNPSADGAYAQFAAGQMAMTQFGYWYSAKVSESDPVKNDTIIIPGATWGTQHKNPCITAAGALIHARSKVADDAWKVLEWYHAGEPSLNRARRGWGVPPLKSMYKLMPNETPYQKQVQKVLQSELQISDVAVRYNPYIAQNTFPVAWNKHLEAALRNQISFDQLLQNVEKDVNTVIKEGMDRVK